MNKRVLCRALLHTMATMALAMPFVSLYAANDLRHTVQSRDLEVLINRLYFDADIVQIMLLDYRPLYGKDADKALFSIGGQADLGLFGPITLDGLYTFVQAPLTYSIDSAVLLTDSRATLDTALGRPVRTGLFLRPFGAALYIGGYRERNGDSVLAGSLNIAPVDIVELELFVDGSVRAADSAPDGWFADRLPYPGGLVAHAATRLTVASRPWIIGGYATLSIAEHLPVVPAVVLRGGYDDRSTRVLALVGWGGFGYVATDGRSRQEQWHVAARAETTLFSMLALRADLDWSQRYGTLQRNGLLSERSPHTLRTGARATLSLPFDPQHHDDTWRTELAIDANGTWRSDFATGPIPEATGTISPQVKIWLDWFSAALDYRAQFLSTGRIEHAIDILLDVDASPFDIVAKIGFSWETQTTMDAGLAIEFDIGWLSLRQTIELERAIVLDSVGFADVGADPLRFLQFNTTIEIAVPRDLLRQL